MRFVFYLNGQQLDAYLSTRTGVERIEGFPATETGRSRFAEFLAGQTAIPCQLLVDLIEEEFREETLPHVAGSDKKILHNRHAARLFRTTPFRHSRVISRDKTGRRDDHILFSALINSDIVEPWLDIIRENRIPLTGVYSLPIITRRLVRLSGTHSDNVLVITQQRGNNLRETFVKNGQVRFSRLAPLLDSDCTIFGVMVQAEIDKTKRYLNTLKLLAFNDELEVLVVTDDEHLQSVKKVCMNSSLIRYKLRNISDVAAKLGMHGYEDTSYADSLFVHLLSHRRIINHYAQPDHLLLYRTYNTGRVLKAFAGVIAAVAIFWTGINLVDSLLLKHETTSIQIATDQVQSNLRQLTGATYNEDINPEDILAAVKLSQALEARLSSPEALLASIGKVLQVKPELVLDKLEWSVQQPVIIDETDQETESTGYIAVNTTDNKIRNIIIARGHIRNFDGSFLKANHDVREFVDLLSKQPNVVASNVIELPVNTSSSANLEGKLHTNNQPDTAEFGVQVILETGNEKS